MPALLDGRVHPAEDPPAPDHGKQNFCWLARHWPAIWQSQLALLPWQQQQRPGGHSLELVHEPEFAAAAPGAVIELTTGSPIAATAPAATSFSTARRRNVDSNCASGA
jgi:hypothetical protein